MSLEAVTALALPAMDGRFYWLRAAERIEPPYAVAQVVGEIGRHTMEGPVDLVTTRFQVDIYDTTYGGCVARRRALKAALDGHSNGAVRGIFFETARDLPVDDRGGVTRLFRISLDFSMSHKEG